MTIKEPLTLEIDCEWGYLNQWEVIPINKKLRSDGKKKML
jgi:hypothetical protein